MNCKVFGVTLPSSIIANFAKTDGIFSSSKNYHQSIINLMGRLTTMTALQYFFLHWGNGKIFQFIFRCIFYKFLCMCAEDKSPSFLSVYISNQIFWNTLYTFYFTVDIWCGASADKKGSTMLQSVRRSQSINRVALKTKFFCGELPVHPPGQRFPVAREGRPLIRNPLDQL